MAVFKSSSVFSRRMKCNETQPHNFNGETTGDYALPENGFELFLFHQDPNEIVLMQFFDEGVTPVAGDFTLANSLPIMPTTLTSQQNSLRFKIFIAGFRPGKMRPWFYLFKQAGSSANTMNWNLTVTNEVTNLTPGQKITGQL